jgi:hypothetical protein
MTMVAIKNLCLEREGSNTIINSERSLNAQWLGPALQMVLMHPSVIKISFIGFYSIELL